MFIDVHTHILPYVDDGSDTWETSLELLRQGEKEGVVAAIATPHVLSEADYKYEADIITKFNELKQRANDAKLKIQLFLGCEIYVQPDMTLEHKISTINHNGKYFLVEFPMTSIPRFVAEKFFDFIVDEKVPIVAHPERNIGFMNRPNLAFEFVQRGALMQVNSPSIIGKHGNKAQQLAFQFIENDLVHFVGSDCHNPNHRSMALKEAYNIVYNQWGKEKADLLFYENAKNMINGQDIHFFEPVPIGEEKKSIWQRLAYFTKKKIA